MGFIQWLKSLRKPKTIKLGLALGSGGARGFAHVGVLTALSESGIEFDIVAGTSIGSIIGAFYSAGYSATDIAERIGYVAKGDVVKMFLKGGRHAFFKFAVEEIGGERIEDLKKPFCAVATEYETGKEKVFSSGKILDAIMASSAIPPVFKPVEIDGVYYVDGAFTNSVPSDVVKSMGADYVVGVDISVGPTSKEYYSKGSENPREQGEKFSDTLIHPDLTGYSTADVFKAGEMFDIGYATAKQLVPKILQDIKKVGKNKKSIKNG
jgi:NTE family protein